MCIYICINIYLCVDRYRDKNTDEHEKSENFRSVAKAALNIVHTKVRLCPPSQVTTAAGKLKQQNLPYSIYCMTREKTLLQHPMTGPATRKINLN